MKMKLHKLKLNPDNPRTFKEHDLNAMVKSLLLFPEMYPKRKIVHADGVVLGGNLRLKGFKEISKMTIEDIAKIISGKDIDKPRVEYLIEYWSDFITNKEIDVEDASNWTDAQKREFVIRDNVSIGSWDYDVLANNWDATELNDWGLSLWNDSEDYSDKNKELDINDLTNEKYFFKLEYSESEYELLKSKLNGRPAEEVFYNALV